MTTSPLRLPFPLSLSVLAALGSGLVAGPAGAAPALEQVTDALVTPVALTHAGDPRLFVTELGGTVRIVEDGAVSPDPFLDISDRTGANGQGLWSVAFPPDFPERPWVFAHYTHRASGDSVISRFELDAADPGRADPGSERELVRIPKSVQLHYGGQLGFGPDGRLYASTGDGTPQGGPPDPLCLSQKLTTLQGKLLRFDVDVPPGSPDVATIPADNPFVDSDSPETWALGLRNPWRFSFDRESGDLWVADVGENRWEEVTLLPAGSPGGANFGWKVLEGSSCGSSPGGCPAEPSCGHPSLLLPTIEYGHQNGRCSVIGGFVSRGGAIPELHGTYVHGDFCSGEVWAARPTGGGSWVSEALPFQRPGLVAFGEDHRGELYVLVGSALLRVVDDEGPAAGTIGFARSRIEVDEAAGAARIEVWRAGGSAGAVEAAVTVSGSATPGDDVGDVATTVSWADGDDTPQVLEIPIVDDQESEGSETLLLTLGSPTGGARLGARERLELEILDDDMCSLSDTVLCLNDGRFGVTVDWETTDDAARATGVPLTEDAGTFWFFSANNPEIFVKVLDACQPPFERFWVFIAGLTDVGTRIEVVDGTTGERRLYETELGQGFEAVRDTDAFLCP